MYEVGKMYSDTAFYKMIEEESRTIKIGSMESFEHDFDLTPRTREAVELVRLQEPMTLEQALRFCTLWSEAQGHEIDIFNSICLSCVMSCQHMMVVGEAMQILKSKGIKLP